MSNFIKIRPVGAQLFHVDGQTDMKKLTAVFRYYAKVPSLTQDTRLNSVREVGSRIVGLPVEPTCLRPALKGPYTAELLLLNR